METAAIVPQEIVRLSRIPSLRALAALLVLSLRQQIRGWRMAVLSLLFLLPGSLAVVVWFTAPRSGRGPSPIDLLDFVVLFNLIPHALAPLAALVCSGGIIRDEVEEQTLTYVLLRPLPRPAIYALKLLASLLTSALLTSIFTLATLVLIAWLVGHAMNWEFCMQGLRTVAIFSLAQVAYCGLFSLMALLMRRALVIGVVYIIFFEGLLVSFDTIARRMTVMYYFRVLVLRWLTPMGSAEWAFNLSRAPTATNCVLTLLAAGLVMAVLGSLIFASREFRMKTPEGA
jgi:ABC-2 type transport system permease protein